MNGRSVSRRTFLGAGGVAVARAARPNILLIYTDQQRYDTIRALGNSRIETPNMDRLVREGVAFTHSTTPSPVCMAARWSLQTGQWSSAHRCYSNHHPGPRPAADIPRMLRAQGYRTALVGKNHTYLDAADFDVFEESPADSSAGSRDRDAWLKSRMSANPRLCEQAVPGGIEADGMHGKTNAALRFLESAGRAPIFLFVSYLYPHTPYHVPEPWFSRYIDKDLGRPVVEPGGLEAAGKPFRQIFHQRNNNAILPFTAEQTRIMRSVYYGMVSLVDGEIGRLLRFLDDHKLAGNTLLAFTTDHGDYMGDHGLYTKSPALYDCLVRVPFIVRWPGVVDANRRDGRFVSHVDLLPTFAAASGAPCPAQAQGVNLLPFLHDGGAGPAIRDAAFSEYGIPGQPYSQARLEQEGLTGKKFANPGQPLLPWEGNPVSLAGRIRMARTREWKFVEEQGGTDELYDLQNDPGELTNLASNPAHRSTVRTLRARLARWTASIGA